MIYVSFRLDDPSAISDHCLESEIIKIFSDFNFSLCVAVVPFRIKDKQKISVSKDNIAHLIDAQKKNQIEVVLHGHSHLRRGVSPSGGPSEFAGVNIQEQKILIQEAKKIVEDVFSINIQGFVPPWNTYNKNTIAVLSELGFSFISAGTSNLTRTTPLNSIPATCNLRNARCAVEQALINKRYSQIVNINFHPDDFEEFCYPPGPNDPVPFTSLKELKKFLAWVRSKEELNITNLKNLNSALFHGNYNLIKEFNYYSILPWKLQSILPNTVLLKSDISIFGFAVYNLLRFNRTKYTGKQNL